MTKEQIVEFLDSEGLDGTKKELVQVFERFLNKIEDNPVPSLDKLLDLIDISYKYNEWKQNEAQIMKLREEVLQNGVETNKVQPKEEYINVTKSECDNKTCPCYNKSKYNITGVIECDDERAFVTRDSNYNESWSL